MKKVKLEVRLKDKTLLVNRKKMKLDESLFDANRYESRDDEHVLYLKYHNQNEEFICAEAGDIYSFLERIGLDKEIEVSPCGPYEGKPYSNIALVGKFSTNVWKR